MVSKSPGTLSTLQEIQIKELKEENVTLEEEAMKLQEYLHEVAQRNSQLVKENLKLRETLNQPTHKVADDSKEKVDDKLKLRVLEEGIRELAKERDRLLVDTSDLRVECENLSGQLRVARSHTKSLEDQLLLYQASDNDIALKSKKRIEELQLEVAKWMNTHRQLAAEKDSLKNELAQQRETVLQLLEEKHKLDSLFEDSRKLNDSLSEKSKTQATTIEQLREQLEHNDKQAKEVNKKEGQLVATERRYQETIEELNKKIEEDARDSLEKLNQMMDGFRDKHSKTMLEKEELISSQHNKLTELKLKADRLQNENRALRDANEQLVTLKSAHLDKDELISQLHKKLSELSILNEAQERKIRDLELKKIHRLHGVSGKDESYQRLEDELLKTKAALDIAKQESRKTAETLQRKERSIAHFEEDRLETIRRNNDTHNQANDDHLRELQKRDGELATQRAHFAEFKADVEQKLKQHEELEERLISHSKQTIRNYEQKMRQLLEENEDLKHKYKLLEGLVA